MAEPLNSDEARVSYVAARAAEACLDGRGGVVIIDKGDDASGEVAELYFFGKDMTPVLAILMGLKGLSHLIEKLMEEYGSGPTNGS